MTRVASQDPLWHSPRIPTRYHVLNISLQICSNKEYDCSALAELKMLLEPDQPAPTLLANVDRILDAITYRLEKYLPTIKDTFIAKKRQPSGEREKFLSSMLDCIKLLFDRPIVGKEVGLEAWKKIVEWVTWVLVEIGKVQQIINILGKILRNSDLNTVYTGLLEILEQSSAEYNALDSAQCPAVVFTSTVLKYLNQLAQRLPRELAEQKVRPMPIIQAMHRFLQSTSVAELKQRKAEFVPFAMAPYFALKNISRGVVEGLGPSALTECGKAIVGASGKSTIYRWMEGYIQKNSEDSEEEEETSESMMEISIAFELDRMQLSGDSELVKNEKDIYEELTNLFAKLYIPDAREQAIAGIYELRHKYPELAKKVSDNISNAGKEMQQVIKRGLEAQAQKHQSVSVQEAVGTVERTTRSKRIAEENLKEDEEVHMSVARVFLVKENDRLELLRMCRPPEGKQGTVPYLDMQKWRSLPEQVRKELTLLLTDDFFGEAFRFGKAERKMSSMPASLCMSTESDESS